MFLEAVAALETEDSVIGVFRAALFTSQGKLSFHGVGTGIAVGVVVAAGVGVTVAEGVEVAVVTREGVFVGDGVEVIIGKRRAEAINIAAWPRVMR
jgi:hypothetical protein